MLKNEPLSNTQENNRLIAEFMGWEFRQVTDHTVEAWYEGSCFWLDSNAYLEKSLLKGFCYHEKWDKLMPVVERISRIPLIGAEDNQDVCYPRTFGMPHTDGKIMVRLNGFSLHYGETLLEVTYAAVVEVIGFLNQQKEPHGK
jgi:hypothetical protein